MKRSKKALPEMIPPRICVTFRRTTFRFRPKSPRISFLDGRPENIVNTRPGSPDSLLKMSKTIKMFRNRTHIGLYGLRIQHSESKRYYESNGTTDDPQNYNIKFKIDQQILRPHQPNCPLNLAINRVCCIVDACHLGFCRINSFVLLE